MTSQKSSPALTGWGAETLTNLAKVTKPILSELRIQLAHTQRLS